MDSEMAKGDFIWSDLSTFQLPRTRLFYAGLFKWSYSQLTQPDGSDYEVASTPFGEAAGLFTMPPKFQVIGLPSFWMPYFSVDDVETACAVATRLGGRVEVPPLTWSANDMIALIRDPLGAGFTIHQGTGVNSGGVVHRHGHRTGCSLYISDLEAIREFYEGLFDWHILEKRKALGDCPVRTSSGTIVASIQELSDDRRGEYEFWGIHFAVADASKAIEYIEKNGGEIAEQDRTSGELTILARDPDGAAFFLRAIAQQADGPNADQGESGSTSKWRTVLGLVILYVAVFFEQNWVWGVLFILWTMPALRSGDTYFVESINRRENPTYFWLIIGTWIALSIYLIVSDLAD